MCESYADRIWDELANGYVYSKYSQTGAIVVGAS